MKDVKFISRKEEELVAFYNRAKAFVISKGYQEEIDIVNNRTFESQDEFDFLSEYIYVVLNAGMKNQVAEKIFARYCKIGAEAVKHKGKRKAIEEVEQHYKSWFFGLSHKASIEDKLDFLETKPWIGPITKFHLARNLGIDVAKPDRHLTRLAKDLNFRDVMSMCKVIADCTGERIGVIDVVLWRNANLTGRGIPRINEFWGIPLENIITLDSER